MKSLLLAALFLPVLSAQVFELPVRVKGKAQENLDNPAEKEAREKAKEAKERSLPPVVVINPIRPKLTPLQVSEPVIGAMEEEINRAMTLRLGGLETPYFIQHTLDDADQFSVAASLGGIIGQNRSRRRPLRVQVRVGTSLLDNTHSVWSEPRGGTLLDLNSIPVDNDFWALRHFLWLANDSAYKGAVDAIAKKKSAINSIVRSEVIPDFITAKPVRMVQKVERPRVDEREWTLRVRSLSETFLRFPGIYDSQVSFEAVSNISHIVTSEGTRVKVPDNLAWLRVRAHTQAADGRILYDGAVAASTRYAELAEKDLRSLTEGVAQNLTQLAQAPVGARYVGPVLFEPSAAAQIAAEILGAHLPGSRRPLTDPGQNLPIPVSEFEGRIGSRVLPDWLSVLDDPTLAKDEKGRPLIGGYPVDLEGIVPEPLTLVENGVLKTYLMTRLPVRGLETTNGRARLPGSFGTHQARPSNLLLKASQSQPMAALKQRLLDQIKQQNKPYGILVRKMDFPSAGSLQDLRRQATQSARSGGRIISSPVLAFRIYPDGREELVRGLRFRGVTTRSFRDLLGASEETEVFSYLDNGAPMALPGASPYACAVSVVSPGLLFEELELEPAEEEASRLPVVPPPALTMQEAPLPFPARAPETPARPAARPRRGA